MRNKYIGVAAVAFSSLLFTGCDKEDLKDLFPDLPGDNGNPKTWDVINFEQYGTGMLTEAQSTNGAGPFLVTGKRRGMDGSYAEGNHAAVFNTHTPTGDDTDLYTGPGHPDGADLGKVLIINQDMESTPNDNEYGGTMSLDFSSVGGVTLKEVTVLDIDGYEDMSYVRLYGQNDKMLLEKRLHNKGNNTVQVVDLGATKGVIRLEVVLDGESNGMPAGSGAIDNILFSK
jgi:hypothetical protein